MFQIGAPGWLDPHSTGPSNPWPQYMYDPVDPAFQPT